MDVTSILDKPRPELQTISSQQAVETHFSSAAGNINKRKTGRVLWEFSQ